MSMSITTDSVAPLQRKPGFLQGIMLLLPITMKVMGISVLTPVVHLMLDEFKAVPYHDYMIIGGVLTMPAIWVLLFSPVAGWLADRFGRRNLLLVSMVVYAFVGVAPAFLDDLYAIIAARIGVGICESIVITVSTTMISDYFKGRSRERWMASQTAVASLSALGIIYLGRSIGRRLRLARTVLPVRLQLGAGVRGLRVRLGTPDRTPPHRAIPLQPAAASVHFPWARMLGICGVTLLASISFYTVVTKNAEAMVALGVSDPRDHRTLHHACQHRRTSGYFHLLGVVALADLLAAAASISRWSASALS